MPPPGPDTSGMIHCAYSHKWGCKCNNEMRKKKIDKAKVELVELKESNSYLSRKLVDRDNQISELEAEKQLLKEKIRSYEGVESAANHLLREQVHNLMEIIRWNANARTAEFPFEIEKGQRDDRTRGRGDFNCRPY